MVSTGTRPIVGFIAGAAGTIAVFSGGVAIVAGATETATGLTGTKLNGEKLTEEEAQARISSGVQGIITGIAAIPAGLTGMQANASINPRAPPTKSNQTSQQVGSQGASGGNNITNDVVESPRIGSALKNDSYHAFNDIIDNSAGMATKSSLGNNASLYQLEGSLNGVKGRFEWIIQNGNTTHRMFVPKGTMNGVPIQK